jgi:uncharacterized protein (TIGR04141 family)
LKKRSQKLAIRLLSAGFEPESALRQGIALEPWKKFREAFVVTGRSGGTRPKWLEFLELSAEEAQDIFNTSAYGLIFIRVVGRWFVLSFGTGHAKLEPDAIEHDFGLRVVLNAVDPKKLRSADVKTPDENTLSRRSQTSRGSDQTAFEIDVERDLVRGLAGIPKDKNFGSHVAGSDALTLTRKASVDDLPTVLKETLEMSKKNDYKEFFSWIDQIRYERDEPIINALNIELVEALQSALQTGVTKSLYLAYPVIYDPEKNTKIAYRGFGSRRTHDELDITTFLDDFSSNRGADFSVDDLSKIVVREVDDRNRDDGLKWKLRDCLVFEATCNRIKYVLSNGKWYKIDNDLVRQVTDFFEVVKKYEMPTAKHGEVELAYNERVALESPNILCLDRQLVRPPGATSSIEMCDLIDKSQTLIHVKDEVSSSRLSHLFAQGTVSARCLATEPSARDLLIAKILEVQDGTEKRGFEQVLPDSNAEFSRSDYTIAYAVISKTERNSLPFFSLVSFRQAARELTGLGFKFSFGWIEREKPTDI